MKYFTYIIQSELNGSFYIGQTQNIEKRLTKHNRGENLSTKKNIPYKLIFIKTFDSRSEAYKYEQKLKNFKRRTTIFDLIQSIENELFNP